MLLEVQKWGVPFFTCIKLVVRVLACVHAIAHIKWKRLSMVAIFIHTGTVDRGHYWVFISVKVASKDLSFLSHCRFYCTLAAC